MINYVFYTPEIAPGSRIKNRRIGGKAQSSSNNMYFGQKTGYILFKLLKILVRIIRN